uniref:Ubiquitin-activating enzyme E1 1 n=1 Tax=Rhizophora mucronata TaxID=61149 RepID=A0A2P2KKV6_RHIMU
MTTLRFSQNVSSNTFSVSGLARFCRDSILRREFIKAAAEAATVDFACPIFQSRKRNCLLRLLFSMTSSSVIVSFPCLPQLTPIKAIFFKNSQPRAPDPTMKTLASSSFFWSFDPKTEICAS